jgi:hypothetical protein
MGHLAGQLVAIDPEGRDEKTASHAKVGDDETGMFVRRPV